MQLLAMQSETKEIPKSTDSETAPVAHALPFGAHRKTLPLSLESRILSYLSLPDVAAFYLTSHGMCGLVARWLQNTKKVQVPVKFLLPAASPHKKLVVGLLAKHCRSLTHVRVYRTTAEADSFPDEVAEFRESLNSDSAHLSKFLHAIIANNQQTLRSLRYSKLNFHPKPVPLPALFECPLLEYLDFHSLSEADRSEMTKAYCDAVSAKKLLHLRSLDIACLTHVFDSDKIAPALLSASTCACVRNVSAVFADVPLTSLSLNPMSKDLWLWLDSACLAGLIELKLVPKPLLLSPDDDLGVFANIANGLGKSLAAMHLLTSLHVQLPSVNTEFDLDEEPQAAENFKQDFLRDTVWTLPALRTLVFVAGIWSSWRMLQLLPKLVCPQLEHASLSNISPALLPRAVAFLISCPDLGSITLSVWSDERKYTEQIAAGSQALTLAIRSGKWPNLTHLAVNSGEWAATIGVRFSFRDAFSALSAHDCVRRPLRTVHLHLDKPITLPELSSFFELHPMLESVSLELFEQKASAGDKENETKTDAVTASADSEAKRARVTAPNLTQLTLNFCFSPDFFEQFSFPSLTQLHLFGRRVRLASIESIFVACPCLGSLTLGDGMRCGDWSLSKAQPSLTALHIWPSVCDPIPEKSLVLLLVRFARLRSLAIDKPRSFEKLVAFAEHGCWSQLRALTLRGHFDESADELLRRFILACPLLRSLRMPSFLCQKYFGGGSAGSYHDVKVSGVNKWLEKAFVEGKTCLKRIDAGGIEYKPIAYCD